MGLDVYMVVVIVEDIGSAVQFYRRLGVDIPEGSEKQHSVPIKMGTGLTFLLNDKLANRSYDHVREQPAGGYRILLEFYLKTREAVDAKYAEMTGYGYHSYQAPFETPFGPYFAFINDPDGNTILISAEDPSDGDV